MDRPFEQTPRHFNTIDVFLARRNTAGLRAGVRVIGQTAEVGQAEAMVLRTCAPDVLIRFSRWSDMLIIPEAAVLRRLPFDVAA